MGNYRLNYILHVQYGTVVSFNVRRKRDYNVQFFRFPVEVTVTKWFQCRTFVVLITNSRRQLSYLCLIDVITERGTSIPSTVCHNTNDLAFSLPACLSTLDCRLFTGEKLVGVLAVVLRKWLWLITWTSYTCQDICVRFHIFSYPFSRE
jgi:hypothetical protein